MDPIAQTNLQLYNQLRCLDRGANELTLVSRAYQLAVTLYAGCFQADGKPFIAHSVGVASITTHLGLPTDIIAAAMLHNIYGNGDFGDGRSYQITESRRRFVRDAVGPRVESLLVRFRDLRITPDTIEQISGRIDRLDPTDRNLVLMELADYLEKYVDCGVLYFGDGRWMTDRVEQYGGRLIEIARELGQPKLATMLEEAFARVAEQRGQVPDVLRPSDDRQYLALTVPRSCRRRLWPLLRPRLARTSQELRWRVRPRHRVRQLGRALGRAMTTLRNAWGGDPT